MTDNAMSNEQFENLTSDQVNTVFEVFEKVWNDESFQEFAINGGKASYLYPQSFNPQILNDRMKSITLLSGRTITPDLVDRALANPAQSERELLEISEVFEYSNSAYKRILKYLSNLPAWDWSYYCKNAKKGDYKSKEYKEALEIIKDFTERFDVKTEMPIVMRQLLRQETFFSVLRDEGERYVLQELPSDYCLITGRFDYGMLFSFNYMFFQRQGIKIDLYPSVFKETYAKLMTQSNNEYNPTLSLDYRGNSSWVLWNDCSPKDGFWMWKFTPEMAARIPYFAPIFPDLAQLPTVRSIQNKEYLSAAAKILFTELPFLKDTKASVKDALSMSPAILGNFMALVRTIMDNDAIKFIEAPAVDAKMIEFKHDNDLQSSYSRNTITQSGVSANLISNFDQKMNALESELSSEVDEQLVQSIYPSCNAFMEYQINQRLEAKGNKFRFSWVFEGTQFHTNQDRRKEDQIGLMDRGIICVPKIAAAWGMSPFAMEAMMMESNENEWVDNLTPIQLSSQMSGGSSSPGRPRKSDSSLSEEGMNTRDAGSNITKGKV